jgi:hypothetical protein
MTIVGIGFEVCSRLLVVTTAFCLGVVFQEIQKGGRVPIANFYTLLLS